jgi:hypothetical protein
LLVVLFLFRIFLFWNGVCGFSLFGELFLMSHSFTGLPYFPHFHSSKSLLNSLLDKKHISNTKPYTHVIFLGGTNDLGRSRSASDIFTDIKTILAIPLATGAEVLIMTVPECAYKADWLDKGRDELNSSLKRFSEESEKV